MKVRTATSTVIVKNAAIQKSRNCTEFSGYFLGRGGGGGVKGSADRRIWPKISSGLRISTIISADLRIQ